MNRVTVFAGLDYADAFVQVCVMDASGAVLGNRRCDNDWQAIAHYAGQFIDPATGRGTGDAMDVGGQVRGAIEACGGAADLADELVQRGGWSVDLAHPGYVNRMKQNEDKHDAGDAHLLADLERVGYLPRVWLAPQAVRELRRLVRYRQQHANQRRAIKLRVGALLREHRLERPDGRTWTKRWRAWLERVELPEQSRWIINRHVRWLAAVEAEIAEVEARLEQLTRDDALVNKLRGYAGIGLVTACVLRAEIGDFGRFRTGKQLSRFCGLSPRNASSGLRQADAGLIKACSPLLRATLIEAAHRLMRYEPRWREFTARLAAAGKKKSLIGAAVANRWVRWLFHEVQRTPLPRAA